MTLLKDLKSCTVIITLLYYHNILAIQITSKIQTGTKNCIKTVKLNLQISNVSVKLITLYYGVLFLKR